VQTSEKRVALITGAGKRRVGNVVAEMLAAKGFAVALHYRSSADAARQTVQRMRQRGVDAEMFQADVAEEADVVRMFREVAARFGRLDALVTAAAVWEPKPLEQTTADDLRRQFDVNAVGTFLCCREAGLVMVEQPQGGAIVTIGDWAVARPYAGYASYFVSKGAIATLTRTLAVELAARNPAVRVNCILPGPVMVPDDLAAEERRQVINATLVRHLGTPEHVGHAVLFLVENDFVTGACIPVDGGRTIANMPSR